VLWDRKSDGGFPETKELKRRCRDLVEPGMGLGHVDRDHRKAGEVRKGERVVGGEDRGAKGDGKGVDEKKGSGGKDGAEVGSDEKCEDCA